MRRSFSAITQPALLLLFLLLSVSSVSLIAAPGQTSPSEPTSESRSSDTSEQKLPQVSQATGADSESVSPSEKNELQSDIPGIGATFDSLLDSLLSLTLGAENRFRYIRQNIPLVPPDLYKVFITL